MRWLLILLLAACGALPDEAIQSEEPVMGADCEGPPEPPPEIMTHAPIGWPCPKMIGYGPRYGDNMGCPHGSLRCGPPPLFGGGPDVGGMPPPPH